jgi:ribosomal-protein-alanine N-acetyltransferase
MALLWPEDPWGKGRLAGARTLLRRPTLSDYPAWAELRAQSRAFLEPWEPDWEADALTRAAFRVRIERYDEGARSDRLHAWFIFTPNGKTLVGALNLSNLRRGVTQAATLGYWTGEAFAGQGYMTDAVRTVTRYAFASLSLHRVEAACQPHNVASRRVLAKAGYRLEGFAPRYLMIGGVWADHLMFARSVEDEA